MFVIDGSAICPFGVYPKMTPIATKNMGEVGTGSPDEKPQAR
jgi:hypothetical protein